MTALWLNNLQWSRRLCMLIRIDHFPSANAKPGLDGASHILALQHPTEKHDLKIMKTIFKWQRLVGVSSE